MGAGVSDDVPDSLSVTVKWGGGLAPKTYRAFLQPEPDAEGLRVYAADLGWVKVGALIKADFTVDMLPARSALTLRYCTMGAP
jgi:hypothetical protein